MNCWSSHTVVLLLGWPPIHWKWQWRWWSWSSYHIYVILTWMHSTKNITSVTEKELTVGVHIWLSTVSWLCNFIFRISARWVDLVMQITVFFAQAIRVEQRHQRDISLVAAGVTNAFKPGCSGPQYYKFLDITKLFSSPLQLHRKLACIYNLCITKWPQETPLL